MVMNIDYSIKGLEKLEQVVTDVPPAVERALAPFMTAISMRSQEEGRDIIRGTSASQYSTGLTADLMSFVMMPIAGGFSSVIGPETGTLPLKHRSYPLHISRVTGGVTMNRAVQILPHSVRWGYQGKGGTWIFIKNRKGRPAHPWMQGIADLVKDQAGAMFRKELDAEMAKVEKAARGISLKGLAEHG